MKTVVYITIGLIIYLFIAWMIARFCGLSNDEKDSDL